MPDVNPIAVAACVGPLFVLLWLAALCGCVGVLRRAARWATRD